MIDEGYAVPAGGFNFAPGYSWEYAGSEGAQVQDENKCYTIDIEWRGEPKRIFYQGGPYLELSQSSLDDPKTTVLARFNNSLIAAATWQLGGGAVGLVGPHPEAPPQWYLTSGHKVQHNEDLLLDLVSTAFKTVDLTKATSWTGQYSLDCPS